MYQIMSINMKSMYTIGGYALAICMLFTASVTTASAQYYSNDYYETRASLIAQIESLLAQIARLESNSGGSSYRPTSNSVVDVDVSAASVDDDAAELFGQIDLNSARYADVWFAYGRTQSLENKSRSGRIDRYTSENFRGDIFGLRSDTRYYYQAVAKDDRGRYAYSEIRSFTTDDDRYYNNSYNNRYDDCYDYWGRYDDCDNDRYNRYDRDRLDDDAPDVDTGRADDITERSAEIDGEVDMNDYKNGLVFFVYGEDEDYVEDIADDYDEFRDIDEEGDDLQKEKVDSDLDRDEEYEITITGLDDDTEYYFAICVEFEDDDDDEIIICGDVEDFETDRD